MSRTICTTSALGRGCQCENDCDGIERDKTLRRSALDFLECTAEPMYVHMLRGKDCEGGCRLALQNALAER